MSPVLKLSSPATGEFWEVPVLYEDEHLLAVDKPSGLLSSPDPHNPDRPVLLHLLHAGIAEGKAWARDRGLTYLVNAHRLDAETCGVLLLARSKPVLAALANLFSSQRPYQKYVALVQGTPKETRFTVEAKLAPHSVRPGTVRVDPKHGKHARTVFEVVEKFSHWTLLKCEPSTGRTHQIRVHLRWAGLPLAGDALYGGRPLLLSRLKPGYRPKRGAAERPLLGRAALHAEELALPHPVTQELVRITAPWPKDLSVALKYLRRYAAGPVMPPP
jgi:RluA family pseudouridine synthase